MKFATIAALISVVSAGHEGTAATNNGAANASDPGNNGYNGNKVERNATNGYDKQVDLQMGRDDMKVRYDDDYYQGEVEMEG